MGTSEEDCSGNLLDGSAAATDPHQRIRALIASGQHATALSEVDRLLLTQPGRADLWNLRGCAESRLGRFVASIAAFSRAIELRAEFAEAHCNRSAAHRACGQLADAVRDAGRAVKLNPGLAIGYHLLGREECLVEKRLCSDAPRDPDSVQASVR